MTAVRLRSVVPLVEKWQPPTASRGRDADDEFRGSRIGRPRSDAAVGLKMGHRRMFPAHLRWATTGGGGRSSMVARGDRRLGAAVRVVREASDHGKKTVSTNIDDDAGNHECSSIGMVGGICTSFDLQAGGRNQFCYSKHI